MHTGAAGGNMTDRHQLRHVLTPILLVVTVACTTEQPASHTTATTAGQTATATTDTSTHEAAIDTSVSGTEASSTDTSATGPTNSAAFLGQSFGDQQASADLPPVAFQAAANADENLFLTRFVDESYRRAPGQDASTADVVAWLATLRGNAAWARAVIRERGLDQDVDTLYQNMARFADAYENYLASIGLVEKQLSRQQLADAAASAWKGYETASDVEKAAKHFGASKDDAETAGTLGGILYGAYEYAQRQQQADDTRRAAIATYRRALDETRDAVSKRAGAISAMLTRRYRWEHGESGFDDFESRYLSEYMKRRPRDPFVRVQYANTRATKETPADVLRDAYTCLHAAELVPVASAYDIFRQAYFANAAELACFAAANEAGDAGYSAHPTLGAQALSFARGYLAMDAKDTTGRGHAALARALAFTGRYAEGLDAATTALNRAPDAWRADSAFCYRYACLLSLGGRADLVGGWLSLAYKNGFNSIGSIRNAPDFQRFKTERPDEYATLTAVNVAPRIVYGVFTDDIVVTNNSAFGLTNLRVRMTIRKGAQTWTPEIACASVVSGGACKAEGVVSIPNDRYDSASFTLACDQCQN
jgi:hypothetical protein